MLSYRKLAMRVLGRPLHTGGGNDSPRPASQRAAAFLLTAAMLTSLTAPAFAGTWDIEKGDITVKAGDEGTNNVKQGDNDFVKDEGDTIITGESKENTVTIDTSEGNVDVTFDDLKIDASSGNEAAVSVTGKGDTNIELDGDNELKGGDRHAGLEHNQTVDGEGNVTSGKLTIQDDNDKAGSLTATGGYFGAGIGGGSAKAGQVTITGGTITATGEDGAGIGGGQGNMSSNAGNADIEISGGTITAAGGDLSAGIGGGTFSGLMASTNYYFPKSKRGFALGVQGGLSDFGTSLVQFVTPIVITFSVFGILGSPQHEVVAGQVKEIWLQNAGWIWVPLVVILSILAIVLLRSVPVTANFKTQMSIFKSKHTWFMTLFYYGTFATFAGLGAHFALMGDGVFNHIEGAPSAIAFAWVGPAIGALARVGAGKVSDKIRGGRVTTIMAAAVIIGLIFLCVYKPDSVMGC